MYEPKQDQVVPVPEEPSAASDIETPGSYGFEEELRQNQVGLALTAEEIMKLYRRQLSWEVLDAWWRFACSCQPAFTAEETTKMYRLQLSQKVLDAWWTFVWM